MMDLLRKAVVFHQVVERSEDERQRSTQFVCDVGEEAQALLIHLLFLLTLSSLQFQGIAQRQFPFV